MAYNVVELRRTASLNVDSYNRTATHTADLPNGSVVTLGTKNADGSWAVTAPTATSGYLWMITSPEVVRINKTSGGSIDRRDFTNKAGIPMDATLLQRGDIIGMTGEGITDIEKATTTYLVPQAGTTLKSATEAPAAGVTALKKIGVDTFHVGDPAIIPATVPMYIFEVVAN